LLSATSILAFLSIAHRSYLPAFIVSRHLPLFPTIADFASLPSLLPPSFSHITRCSLCPLATLVTSAATLDTFPHRAILLLHSLAATVFLLFNCSLNCPKHRRRYLLYLSFRLPVSLPPTTVVTIPTTSLIFFFPLPQSCLCSNSLCRSRLCRGYTLCCSHTLLCSSHALLTFFPSPLPPLLSLPLPCCRFFLDDFISPTPSSVVASPACCHYPLLSLVLHGNLPATISTSHNRCPPSLLC
ncbi:hypothetical protein B296_00025609, partial [Ensete ventricosum]